MELFVETDLKPFHAKVASLIEKTAPAALEGMKVAMKQHKQDCFDVEPKVPYESGNLKESHKTRAKIQGRFVEGAVFTDGVPYAMSIHEGISRWGTPYKYKTLETGAKWMQSKMIRFHSRYKRLVVHSMRRIFR